MAVDDLGGDPVFLTIPDRQECSAGADRDREQQRSGVGEPAWRAQGRQRAGCLLPADRVADL
jgi:hypothetical protein